MEFQRVHQQLLQSHHLFEPLSPVQLQELLASSDLVNLDKGAYVFRQGEPAHAFYYLISGCVKIYRLTPEGQEKILEVTNERHPPRRPRNQHPRPRTPGVLRVNSPAA